MQESFPHWNISNRKHLTIMGHRSPSTKDDRRSTFELDTSEALIHWKGLFSHQVMSVSGSVVTSTVDDGGSIGKERLVELD